MARPTKYTIAIADEICSRLSEGESLLKICKDEHMPTRSSVHLWLLDGKHKAFSDNYERAREMQADYLFDESLEIADGIQDKIVGDDKSDSARVSAQEARIRQRNFYIGKVRPRKYGDKLDLTSNGDPLPQPLLYHAVSNRKRNRKGTSAK